MTIKELMKDGIDNLKNSYCQEAFLKVRILMAHVLGTNKEYLIINEDEAVQEQKAKLFYEGIEKLKARTPIEYITHEREFMKLNFYVDEDVLIPRPDTEILVEEVLKRSKKDDMILDLCTGSGAIAVSLAKYGDNLNVTGIDISNKALEIAKHNSEKNEVNINLYQSDIFENVKEHNWDIIVSNPPYIETETIEGLEPEVKKEPRIALDGGEDGLNFYRIIIKHAPEYLKEDGVLAIEIGYNQAKKIMEIIEKNGNFYDLCVIKDLEGNDRVITCKKGGE